MRKIQELSEIVHNTDTIKVICKYIRNYITYLPLLPSIMRFVVFDVLCNIQCICAYKE